VGHHPGPADIGMLIEVSDSTLGRDRGEKQLAYSRNGVPIYWIVNLIDGQLEDYSGPTQMGYSDRGILTSGEQVSLVIDGKEVGRISVSSILPRGDVAGETKRQNAT
jgi:Uma2 family endonuclease